ncbi:hypothetical protein GO003_001910 [Methylicorpusculum oleiharenae]|uniref:hypothetical protein n=1 Tax=Methylicorpusculum oleiharenae TaxID=1338687 RepID=UPI0019D06D21|nr:hypothetical protein [Methylicorpusculum oleiharenae]MCD2449148.1 hypothetical protein [Methylicorpusculum oleiharenae]
MKFSDMFGKGKNRRELALAKQQKQALAMLHFQNLALVESTPGVGNDIDQELVVSLTTFPARINDVYLTIESLFQQSLKADKVVLWLSKAEFDPLDLPQTLRNLERRGLTIAFCDEDLGPYKKFYYALSAFPDSLLITVDDDILYPPDMIDQLYRAWKREPQLVHCQRAHKIAFGRNGSILPYKHWNKTIRDEKASPLIMPTGVGGVLYFPGCFDPAVSDKAQFMRLAPKADDIWLKAMTLKHGVLCRKVPDLRPWNSRYLTVEYSQQLALKRINKKTLGGNDQKILDTFDYYNLWSLLNEDNAE